MINSIYDRIKYIRLSNTVMYTLMVQYNTFLNSQIKYITRIDTIDRMFITVKK